MYNKKIIAKGLVVLIAFSTFSTNTLAYNMNKDEVQTKETRDTFFNENIFETIIDMLFNRKIENKNILEINKNVREGSVLVVNLNEGESIPIIIENPDGYETIKVITNGNKKLVERDYRNLSFAKIPKIDLSEAHSDIIPSGIFNNAQWLTEFKFPQGVKTIEDATSTQSGAFYNCRNMTNNLVIPDSVTNIGSYAFYNCSGLTGSLIIPDSVETIGLYSFYNCSNLEGSLELGSSIKSINSSAFELCTKLTGNLTIPNSVLTIGDRAFKGCSGFNGSLKISELLQDIGDYTFEGCSGFTGSLVIPDSLSNIGWSVFENCSGFTGTLTIGSSIDSIGVSAFYGCSGFTGNLIIPNSVTIIKNYAFGGCSGFTGNLVIPNSVKTIESSAFENCTGFTGDFLIPTTLTDIGGYAFKGCSGITGILIIPESLTSMGYYAFKDTSIEKIIVKLDESDINSTNKRNIINALPIENTFVEMSYNLDIEGTWVESIEHIKARPEISTYTGVFENNEGRGISLEIIEASSIKELTILKDGLNYNLEKSKNGKYIFNEIGDYQVYVKTDLGTISNISFKNLSPISEPHINFNGNILEISHDGILKYILKESLSEEFNNPSNLNISFSNPNWIIENGVLKSEPIENRGATFGEFIVNLENKGKGQISIKTSSEDDSDWGLVYVNEDSVYQKSGTLDDFEIIEFDLKEGENSIQVVYSKDNYGSDGDDAIFVEYLKILKEEPTIIDCDTIEYRINGGDWKTYIDSFELDYPIGTKVLIESRAKHDGFLSLITSKEVIVELSIEKVEEKVEHAEQSKDTQDIEEARDLVNNLPESMNKDRLQDRLDAIFPNISLDRHNVTSNLDVYIKSDNMLSLSLDTNSITFENFSGVEDVEKEKAIILTVSSSLPYKINAYMPTEIKGSEGNTIDNDILGIRANGEIDYSSFEDTVNSILLLDVQPKGNNITHEIDLMLKGDIAHNKDVYKTTIKFVAEQE